MDPMHGEPRFTEPTSRELAQRLDRLERENRWWKRIAAAAILLLGLSSIGDAVRFLAGKLGFEPSTAVTSLVVPDEIRARRFVVVDEDGNTIITLGELLKGWPWIGMTRADRKGEAALGVDQDGEPYLALWGGPGRFDRVWLRVTRDGSPKVRLIRDLKFAVELAADAGSAAVTVYDADERARAVLGGTKLESPRTGIVQVLPASSLVFFDRDGRIAWKAP